MEAYFNVCNNRYANKSITNQQLVKKKLIMGYDRYIIKCFNNVNE